MNHRSLLLWMLFGSLLALAVARGNSNASLTGHVLGDHEDLNEIPVRYDDTELWRIHNISDALLWTVPVTEIMENKFGANIWKENPKYVDLSITKTQAKGARSFLNAHRLDTEVLARNVQDLIDEEQLEGIRATQAKLGRRISELGI